MAISDPIADMLTKIRNASAVKHEKVDTNFSNYKFEILKVLKNEGYIRNYKKISKKEEAPEILRVFLKYDENHRPVIRGIKSISTPGRRIYHGYKGMPRVLNGLGTLIVSTSEGVLTGRKATEAKLGGEVICSVW